MLIFSVARIASHVFLCFWTTVDKMSCLFKMCWHFLFQMLLILLGVLLIIRLVFVDGPGYFLMFLAALCFGVPGCSESSIYPL